MNKSESLVKLAPALVAAQKKMGAALKDSKNPFFKSKYADLNSVIDAAVPTLNEEGIAVLQAVNLDSVETILLHESGEYISSSTPIVTAKQNDPQALGSAISYSKRYGLQAMAVLKAEDDDGESAMNRPTKSETEAPKKFGSSKLSPEKEEVKQEAKPASRFTKTAPVKEEKEADLDEALGPKEDVAPPAKVVTKPASRWQSKRTGG